MTKAPSRSIGRELNKSWGVNARQALYSREGTWYHRLTKFPGALLDTNGYVLFETMEQYISCTSLNLGKQTNCPKGISSISTYMRVRNHVEQASDLSEPLSIERVTCVTNRIVRDTPLARRVKRLHNNKCQLCGLMLLFFGGESYAEAHHIKPLGSVHHGPDVAENIICVCPNCHAQLDYGAVELNKAALLFVPEHDIADEYVAYHNNSIYKGSSHRLLS